MSAGGFILRSQSGRVEAPKLLVGCDYLGDFSIAFDLDGIKSTYSFMMYNSQPSELNEKNINEFMEKFTLRKSCSLGFNSPSGLYSYIKSDGNVVTFKVAKFAIAKTVTQVDYDVAENAVFSLCRDLLALL
jgi:hypothetical protein